MRISSLWNASLALFITYLALAATTTARAQSSHPRFEQDYMLNEVPLESVHFPTRYGNLGSTHIARSWRNIA